MSGGERLIHRRVRLAAELRAAKPRSARRQAIEPDLRRATSSLLKSWLRSRRKAQSKDPADAR